MPEGKKNLVADGKFIEAAQALGVPDTELGAHRDGVNANNPMGSHWRVIEGNVDISSPQYVAKRDGHKVPSVPENSWAINLNGFNYGEISQTITFDRPGTVRLSLYSIRECFQECWRTEGSFSVVVDGLLDETTFEEEAWSSGIQWSHREIELHDVAPHSYTLRLRGDRIDPQKEWCGCWVAAISAHYVNAAMARLILPEGNPKELSAPTRSDFPELRFEVYDGGTKYPLGGAKVVFTLTAHETGTRFAGVSPPDRYEATCNEDGVVILSKGALKAGIEEGTEQLQLWVADDPALPAPGLNLVVGAGTAGTGDAYYLALDPGPKQGNDQDALTHTKFARRLRVQVTAKGSGKATSGQVTFAVKPTADGGGGYFAKHDSDEWADVAAVKSAALRTATVTVYDGVAEAPPLWAELGTSQDEWEAFRVQAYVGPPTSAPIDDLVNEHRAVVFRERVWGQSSARIIKASGNGKVSGDGQTAQPQQPFANPLRVKVQDGNAYALERLWVRFKVTGGPAVFNLTDTNSPAFYWVDDTEVWAPTDANGIATSPPLKAGVGPGAVTVTASAPVATNTPTFSLSVAVTKYRLAETGAGGVHEVAKGDGLRLGVKVTSIDTGEGKGGVQVVLTIAQPDDTDTRFADNKTQITLDTKPDGTVSFQLIGGKRTGPVTVTATVVGAEPLPIAVQVVEQVTVETVTPLVTPDPVAPNAQFKEAIQVSVTRQIGSVPQPAVGTMVTFSIVYDPGQSAPYFLDVTHHRDEDTQQCKEGGIATSLPLWAGQDPGSYKVLAYTEHTRKSAEIIITVSGIAAFDPALPQTVQAVQRDLVHNQWTVKAKAANGTEALNQPVQFLLVDGEPKTGSVFQGGQNKYATGTSDSKTGLVTVPDIKIGEGIGGFRVVVSGSGGEPTATIMVQVNAAAVPSNIEFDPPEEPTVVASGKRLRLDVHVTDINKHNIISGTVSFAIQDDTTGGTRFTINTSTTSPPQPIGPDGYATVPPVDLGGSGSFSIKATVDGYGVTASHKVQIK